MKRALSDFCATNASYNKGNLSSPYEMKQWEAICYAKIGYFEFMETYVS